MKILTTTLLLLLLLSCNNDKATKTKEPAPIQSQQKTNSQFQSLLDSANVDGAILIYDLNADTYHSNDFEWSNKGHLPASTFKIPNSIIGLEIGVIKSDSTIFKWDGQERWSKQWEQDLVLKDAFQFSCVPCYQDVARRIGAQKMNEYIKKLEYGNLKIDTTNIDMFWLQGKSRISQFQQIDFLKRFYQGLLPISKRTEKIVKEILRTEKKEAYNLSAKTGLSIQNEIHKGWYVGYVEQKDNVYFFATNIQARKDFDYDAFAKQRIDLTLEALRLLGILSME